MWGHRQPFKVGRNPVQKFLRQPITAVIWDCDDDPDEQVIRNIAQGMTVKKLGNPIRDFVVNCLHHPLLMHEPVQHALKSLFDSSQKRGHEKANDADAGLQLVDILAISFTCINAKFPASWCGFAFDVVTAFGDRGHFVEGTDQARKAKLEVSCERVNDGRSWLGTGAVGVVSVIVLFVSVFMIISFCWLIFLCLID